MKKPAYDRMLIAEMLEEYESHHACNTDLAHFEGSILEQASLLREAAMAEPKKRKARVPDASELAA